MAKKKKEDVDVLDAAVNSLDALYKKYGAKGQVVIPPSNLDDVDFEVERLRQPFPSIDRYMGGGPARGKVTTISGMFSTGKTSLALEMAGCNPDMKIGFVDQEFNWVQSSYVWAFESFGIKPENIIVLHPTYLEDAAEMIEDLCDTCDIVIQDGFDSVAPKAEYEGGMEDNQMGLMARAYKKFFRRCMGKIYRTNTALIITNHLYENIGNVYEPFKEPGGKSIGDYASQKYFLTRGNVRDKDKAISGQEVRVVVNKDKLRGSRGKKWNLYYDNDNGFDIVRDAVELAILDGIVLKTGSWYNYGETSLGQGMEKTKMFLLDNPEMYQEILDRLELIGKSLLLEAKKEKYVSEQEDNKGLN